jgi:hypothetical protein
VLGLAQAGESADEVAVEELQVLAGSGDWIGQVKLEGGEQPPGLGGDDAIVDRRKPGEVVAEGGGLSPGIGEKPVGDRAEQEPARESCESLDHGSGTERGRGRAGALPRSFWGTARRTGGGAASASCKASPSRAVIERRSG